VAQIWSWVDKLLCLFTEEELKRLNEALADDNSYSAVSFDYNSSNKTEEPSAAEASHGKTYIYVLFTYNCITVIEILHYNIEFICKYPTVLWLFS